MCPALMPLLGGLHGLHENLRLRPCAQRRALPQRCFPGAANSLCRPPTTSCCCLATSPRRTPWASSSAGEPALLSLNPALGESSIMQQRDSRLPSAPVPRPRSPRRMLLWPERSKAHRSLEQLQACTSGGEYEPAALTQLQNGVVSEAACSGSMHVHCGLQTHPPALLSSTHQGRSCCAWRAPPWCCTARAGAARRWPRRPTSAWTASCTRGWRGCAVHAVHAVQCCAVPGKRALPAWPPADSAPGILLHCRSSLSLLFSAAACTGVLPLLAQRPPGPRPAQVRAWRAPSACRFCCFALLVTSLLLGDAAAPD